MRTHVSTLLRRVSTEQKKLSRPLRLITVAPISSSILFINCIQKDDFVIASREVFWVLLKNIFSIKYVLPYSEAIHYTPSTIRLLSSSALPEPMKTPIELAYLSIVHTILYSLICFSRHNSQSVRQLGRNRLGLLQIASNLQFGHSTIMRSSEESIPRNFNIHAQSGDIRHCIESRGHPLSNAVDNSFTQHRSKLFLNKHPSEAISEPFHCVPSRTLQIPPIRSNSNPDRSSKFQ